MRRGRPPLRCRVGLAVVVLSGALLATTAAGILDTAVEAQEGGRRVVVVSDSVVAGAERELTDALTRDGWSVVFDAEISRTTYSASTAVAAHGPDLADTVVLSLGVNDGASAATFRTRVESVLAEVRTVPRVFWMNLHEVREEYAAANRVLVEAAAQHPNLQILDWSSVASARPELTVGDGLHLTGAGGVAMTELIGAAVRAVPAPAPPTSAATSPPPTTAALAATVPTASPTTEFDTDETASRGTGRSTAPVRRSSSAWLSVAGWTISGFAIVVGLLVLAGSVLAAWSLWSSRRSLVPKARPSPNHPAVRARQRAERIAAAHAEAQET